jgi:hypothetical protein
MIYSLTFWVVYVASTIVIMLSLSHSTSLLFAILLSIPVSWLLGKLTQLLVVGRVYSHE